MSDLPTFDPSMFTRPDAGDDHLFVMFYMGIIQNDARTTEEGRPIFDDVESVRIMVPGDKSNVIDRPASPHDKARFAKQYAIFKAGRSEEEQLSGTRLADWPFLSRAQVEELKYLGIRTVEQLSEVGDNACGKVAGLTTLKNNAKVWLGRAKGAAEAAKTTKVLEEQANRIETLNKVIEDQAQRLEKLQAQMNAQRA